MGLEADLIQIQHLPLNRSVTPGRSLNLWKPELPCVNGDANSCSPHAAARGLHAATCVQSWPSACACSVPGTCDDFILFCLFKGFFCYELSLFSILWATLPSLTNPFSTFCGRGHSQLALSWERARDVWGHELWPFQGSATEYLDEINEW